MQHVQSTLYQPSAVYRVCSTYSLHYISPVLCMYSLHYISPVLCIEYAARTVYTILAQCCVCTVYTISVQCCVWSMQHVQSTPTQSPLFLNQVYSLIFGNCSTCKLRIFYLLNDYPVLQCTPSTFPSMHTLYLPFNAHSPPSLQCAHSTFPSMHTIYLPFNAHPLPSLQCTPSTFPSMHTLHLPTTLPCCFIHRPTQAP